MTSLEINDCINGINLVRAVREGKLDSPEICRLYGDFELALMQREALAKAIMKLAIHRHPSMLSLSNIVSVIDRLGFSQAISTNHNGVQKADFEPRRCRGYSNRIR